MEFKDINIDAYMARFRIFYPKSLFQPDFKMLKVGRCPVCTKRLYWNIQKTIARCKSVKSNDKFFIRREIYDKLK